MGPIPVKSKVRNVTLLPHSTEDEARFNETAIIAVYGTEFLTNERKSHLFKDRRAGPRNKLRLESYFVYTAFMSVKV